VIFVIPKLETNTIKHYRRDVALQRLYKGKYCRFWFSYWYKVFFLQKRKP